MEERQIGTSAALFKAGVDLCFGFLKGDLETSDSMGTRGSVSKP